MELEQARSAVHILFVDDEQEVLNALRRFLLKETYQKHFFSSGQEALDFAESNPVDILITDLRMPEMDGLKLIGQFRKMFPATLRLICSASRDIDQTIDSINHGRVFRFIPKPLEPNLFRRIVDDAVNYCLLKKERQAMVAELSARNDALLEANTNLRLSEASLKSRENYLSTLTDTAYDAILLTEGLNIVFWNRAAERLLGYSRAAVQGRNLLELIFDQEQRTHWQTVFTDTLRQCQEAEAPRGAQLGEMTVVDRDGRNVLVELSASPAMIEELPHLVIVARNLQHRLEAEQTKAQFAALQRSIERRIEQSLLQSKAPQGLQGVAVAGLSVAASHLDGDFIDYIVYDDRHFDVMIADVMGKGVRAALAGAGLKTRLLKILAEDTCQRPWEPRHQFAGTDSIARIIGKLNRQTATELIELEMLITLNYARFDMEARQMSYISCGHPWTARFCARSGDCEFLEGFDLPLGIEADSAFQANVVPLEPGDIYLFYSDGLTEAENVEQKQYGRSRLRDFLKGNSQLAPEPLVAKLYAEVCAYGAHERLGDDFTVIALKVLDG